MLELILIETIEDFWYHVSKNLSPAAHFNLRKKLHTLVSTFVRSGHFTSSDQIVCWFSDANTISDDLFALNTTASDSSYAGGEKDYINRKSVFSMDIPANQYQAPTHLSVSTLLPDWMLRPIAQREYDKENIIKSEVGMDKHPAGLSLDVLAKELLKIVVSGDLNVVVHKKENKKYDYHKILQSVSRCDVDSEADPGRKEENPEAFPIKRADMTLPMDAPSPSIPVIDASTTSVPLHMSVTAGIVT